MDGSLSMSMMLLVVEVVGVLMCDDDDVKKWSLLLLLLLSMNCGLLWLPQRTEAMNAEQIFKRLIDTATSTRSSNRHGDGSIIVCDLRLLRR